MTGLHPVPRDPVRPGHRSAVLPGGLLLPRRTQVQVILHHLPLHLPPQPTTNCSSSYAVSPAASEACSSATSAATSFIEAKGSVPPIGAYGSIGLFFL